VSCNREYADVECLARVEKTHQQSEELSLFRWNLHDRVGKRGGFLAQAAEEVQAPQGRRQM